MQVWRKGKGTLAAADELVLNTLVVFAQSLQIGKRPFSRFFLYPLPFFLTGQTCDPGLHLLFPLLLHEFAVFSVIWDRKPIY